MSALKVGIRFYMILFRWFILLILFLIHVEWHEENSFGYALLILLNLLFTVMHFGKWKNSVWKVGLIMECFCLLLFNIFFSLEIEQLLYLYSTFLLIGIVFSKVQVILLTFAYSVAASIVTYGLYKQEGAAGNLFPIVFLCGFIFYIWLTYITENIVIYFKKWFIVLLYTEKLSKIDTFKSLHAMTEIYIQKLIMIPKCYLCMYSNNSFIDNWYNQYYTRLLQSNDQSKKEMIEVENYLGEPERFWFIPIRLYQSSENLGGLLLPAKNLNRFDLILLRILLSSFLNQWQSLIFQQGQAHSLKKEVRSQVAQDLHDGLAQQLFFLSAQIFQMKNNLSKGNLDQLDHLTGVMQQQAAACQNEVRTFIAHLKGERTESNIRDGIEQLVKRLTYHTPVNIFIEFNGDVYEDSTEIEESVYRLIEEAINNSLKHAKAANISVIVQSTVVQWTIKIIDDGIGFDPFLKKEGEPQTYGLSGLRERVDHLGGHISLSSSIGMGTEMVAVIPRGGIKEYV